MVKDLTNGSVKKQLIGFSLPIILGNLFQLTYNAVDSIIVGRFAGQDALAAVGVGNPVISIVILGISGICIGASVIMSEYFGAGDRTSLKREVATTILFGLLFAILIMGVGLLTSKGLMKLLNVPEQILSDSIVYLRIIFFGIPFTFLYNAIAASLRSVGDSNTPVKFLAIASVMNALLDVLFVGVLSMGVAGAALATVIAEATSVVLCVIYVYRKVPVLILRKKDLVIDKVLLKVTLQHSSITALQQSAQPIGKLIIQSVINPLGVEAIAAFNAVNRVDDFAFTPEQSISHGMMTFIAQNRGAGKKERVRKGLSQGLLLECFYWIFICSTIFLLRTPVMNLFVTENNVGMIPIGVEYLGLMAFFYVLPAFTNGMQGYFRGMGKMKITLIGTLTQISVRVLFVIILVPKIGLIGVAYASALGWILMLIVELPYYFILNRKYRETT